MVVWVGKPVPWTYSKNLSRCNHFIVDILITVCVECSRYEIFANFAKDVTLANIYFANISHRCTSLVRCYRTDISKTIEHFFKPVGGNDSSISKAVHAAAVLAA